MIKVLGYWIGIENIAKEEFAALRTPSTKAVLKAALHFERAVKMKLIGPRTGRIYTIRGRVHQASAPGEPPAAFTGQLRRSITHTIPAWDGDTVSSEVGTNLDKAAILEFGGVAGNGARILPRPFMSATFLEEEETLREILGEATES